MRSLGETKYTFTTSFISFSFCPSLIFNEDVYFNSYENHILDYIIQNNFMILNSIIPMTDPKIYNSISQQIYEFKNKNATKNKQKDKINRLRRPGLRGKATKKSQKVKTENISRKRPLIG